MADKETMQNETVVVDEEETAHEDVAEAIDAVEASAAEKKAPGEIERLRTELEEARSQADEYLDGWRRAQAEFSNYKKRQQADRARIMELANASLLRSLLPVLDDFERAIATMPDGIDKLSWCHGLLLIKRKLEAVLEAEGVEPIETEGEIFDPYYHEAVTHEVMPGYDEGQIIGEVQRGYVVEDRVLRPALVRVAKAPSSPPEQEGGDGMEGKE